MISMSASAGRLVIKRSKFYRNYFFFGMISDSAVSNDNERVANIDGGFTCKVDGQTLVTGNCQSILIDETEFEEFNHLKIQRLKSNHKIMDFEGMIIALENFQGPITIQASKFS
jgi:hypothetical protein